MDLDDNVNFFNIDAFLSWDFKLGCNLTVGYKNWIGDNRGNQWNFIRKDT